MGMSLINFIYSKILDLPKHHGDPEDYGFCIKREAFIEQTIIRSVRSSYGDVVGMYDLKQAYGLESTNNIFRGSISQYYQHPITVERVINHRQACDQVIHWMDNSVLASFMYRKFVVLTVAELNKNPSIAESFQNSKGQIFCKSLEKYFAHTAPVHECIYHAGLYGEHKGYDKLVMISEVEDFGEEYRCFIINNEVVSISSYDDYEIKLIPKGVIDMARLIAGMVKSRKNIFPSHYVLDLGVLNNSEVVKVVECNDIGLSGRYIRNDFCRTIEAFTGLVIDKSYQAFVEEIDTAMGLR